MKLKHPQHARFQVPDSAIVTPVLGDRKARLQKGVDLSRGSCHLDFTAKATYEHTISGGTFKRRALDFSLEAAGTQILMGKGKLHNNKLKVGGKRVLGGYWASVYSTDENPGLTTYGAHAVYRFSGGYFRRKVNGHRVSKPPTADTVISFQEGLSLQESGQPCLKPDRDAVQRDFSQVIASAQLTN